MKGIIATSDFESLACCMGMHDDLLDKQVEFDRTFKCYYIHLHGDRWQTMGYCMYCGAELPDLRSSKDGSDPYRDALEEAVGKEYCDITEDEIPKEFKTDEWWKKRGL